MDKKIQNLTCHCGNDAWTCDHISEGKIVYKCAKTKMTLKEKSLTEFIVNPNQPCDFLHEQHYDMGKIYVHPKKKVIEKIKWATDELNLYNKIDYFIVEKYFVLFQEIEIACKKMNIPIFDHNKETMYEFCCRIKEICKKRDPMIVEMITP